jgi:hypothetical protein
MITMYAIVSARTREIGTLRALEFSRLSILFFSRRDVRLILLVRSPRRGVVSRRTALLEATKVLECRETGNPSCA